MNGAGDIKSKGKREKGLEIDTVHENNKLNEKKG